METTSNAQPKDDKPSKEICNLAMLIHIASFAGLIIPAGNLIGPLVVWLMKRNEHKFIDQCGKNCINFNISLLIYACISCVLMFVGIGFLLLLLIGLMAVIFTIMAIMKAQEGTAFQYPLTITFIK
ncbi:DUF4870 domain-containing protein [Shewanella gaetbuli]